MLAGNAFVPSSEGGCQQVKTGCQCWVVALTLQALL
jgi:hypothetical protein